MLTRAEIVQFVGVRSEYRKLKRRVRKALKLSKSDFKRLLKMQ